MQYEVQFVLDHRGRLGEILFARQLGFKWGPGDVAPPLCVRVMECGDITPEQFEDKQYRIHPDAFQVVGGVTNVRDDRLALQVNPREKWRTWQEVERAAAFFANKLGGAGSDELMAQFTRTGHLHYAADITGAKHQLLNDIGQKAVDEFDARLIALEPKSKLPTNDESEKYYRDLTRQAVGHVITKNALGKL